jgi:hypothetical protein
MESNNEENNKPQKISRTENEEDFQFKRGFRLFRNINAFLFVFLLLCSFNSRIGLGGVVGNSFPNKLENGLIGSCFYLFLIQCVYLIPTIIFCLVTKKYPLLKASLIVSGLTLLLCPVTCFGGGFFLSQIIK